MSNNKKDSLTKTLFPIKSDTTLHKRRNRDQCIFNSWEARYDDSFALHKMSGIYEVSRMLEELYEKILASKEETIPRDITLCPICQLKTMCLDGSLPKPGTCEFCPDYRPSL